MVRVIVIMPVLVAGHGGKGGGGGGAHQVIN